MTCRWDRATKAHLIREHLPDCTAVACQGCKPCTHDDDGNPARHCPQRVRCTSHLGWDEYACPTCLTKARTALSKVSDLLALMPDETIYAGVNSEAASLAGPHADHVTAQWRLVNAARSGQPVDELDHRDPYTCFTMHERYIREDLGHDAETLVSPTVSAAASYLAWALTDLARSEDHAWHVGALLKDAQSLAAHLEAVLSDSRRPERGAPCPACIEAGRDDVPPLVRSYSHWCTDDECERVHVDTDERDLWLCRDDPAHRWDHETYSRWVATAVG